MSAVCVLSAASEVCGALPVSRQEVIDHMRDRLGIDQQKASQALRDATCWATGEELFGDRIFLVVGVGGVCGLVSPEGLKKARSEYSASTVSLQERPPCRGAINRYLRSLVPES